ncbi:MAG: SEC59/DGK1/VTE5 family protein [Candidatus Fermentibacter sp.]|nr:SEC59/DGK1/VTE5 family protein [Candidatus Fermentibacter sp.]
MTFSGELLRKAVHLASIVIPLAALLMEKTLLVMVLAGAALLLLLVDYLKLRNHGFKAFFMSAFGELLRKHERQGGITGSTILVASAALTILVYRQETAVAALLFLSLGDSMAALVGRRYGRIRLVCGRTLEGSLAALLSCLFASAVLLLICPFFGWHLTPFALIAGSLAATVVELVDIPLDDNFRIPVISGLVMELLIPG